MLGLRVLENMVRPGYYPTLALFALVGTMAGCSLIIDGKLSDKQNNRPNDGGMDPDGGGVGGLCNDSESHPIGNPDSILLSNRTVEIALDSEGFPHIVHSEIGDIEASQPRVQLIHTWWNGTVWRSETIFDQPATDPSPIPAVRLDS